MDMNQYQPQTDPNMNYQPGYTYMQPPRKKRKLLWLWITLGLIGAAGIAAALMFTVFLPNGPAEAPNYALMLDGSEVMLARGGETVSLGKASCRSDSYGTYLNSVSANNGGTLFYLCNVDENTGEGTLMKVKTTGSRPPEEVAKDVCMAEVSEDGSRVLYVTDMDGAGGDLMLIDKGQAARVAKDVVPGNIEFSKSGEYFAFLEADKTAGGYEYTVYTGRSADDIEEADDFKTDDDLYIFYAYVLDNGTLVYYIWMPGGTDSETRLCACEYGGKPNKLADEGRPVWAGGSDYFYTDEDDTLYYVDGEGEEERVIRDFEYYLGVWDDNRLTMDNRFLMYQKGSSEDTYNLYALTFGQDEEKICEIDRYSAVAGPALKYVSYKMDGELFVSVKGKGGWEETGMDAKPLTYECGRSFYYIAVENETDTKGDLYRYDTVTGEKERLQKDVIDMDAFGDAVYTIDEDGKAYYIAPDGKETRIAEDALELSEGSDGVYIKQEDGEKFSLLFAEPGAEAEKIAGGFDLLIDSGREIEYQMPLPGDVKQALDEMREDAMGVLDILNGNEPDEANELNRSYEESKTLAGELKDRPDVPDEVQDILWDFYFGFWDLGFAIDYANSGDYTEADAKLEESVKSLNDAISAWEGYLENR